MNPFVNPENLDEAIAVVYSCSFLYPQHGRGDGFFIGGIIGVKVWLILWRRFHPRACPD